MSHIYFKVFLGVLCLFFVDAIREMRKYGNELSDYDKEHHMPHLDAEMQAHMRLFRAQRNFYISGFSLFLWVVLRRLMLLISQLAVALAEGKAAIKQAESASAAATAMLKKGTSENEDNDERQMTINELKELKEEKKKLLAENEAALKQAASVSREYDRLLEEHSKLEKKLNVLSGLEESKKDD